MENQELEVITSEEIKGDELAILREKMQVDLAVSTAKAFPRDVAACLEEAIFTATMDYEVAESCTYALPRDGKAISGPSVRLAEILLQSWGNMRAETKVVDETSKHVVSESVAWDLQKNNAVKITVKRSIVTKTGSRFGHDMITVTGNANNSIAFRNALFKVIPRAIVNKVYGAVQLKIIGGAGEFEKRLKDTLKAFKQKYDIGQFAAISLVGHTKLADVKPGDLAILIGIGTSLKEGSLTVDSLFKRAEKTADEKKEELKKKQSEQNKEGKPEEKTEPETNAPVETPKEEQPANQVTDGKIKLP